MGGKLMPEPSYSFFLGIDLGSDCHQLHLIDRDGQTVGQHAIEHGGAGIQEMLNWLSRATHSAAPPTVAAALEAPRGAVMDALLERGHAVFSINPKQLDRFRDRFSVAGAKDDRRDALVLAHSLRTDRPRFRPLAPDDPKVLRLRELARSEDRAGKDLRRTANRLWSYLQRSFPGLLRLCPAADEPWLFDLLRRAGALPDAAARLRLPQLQALLRRHGIRRFSAEQLREHLRDPLPLAHGLDQALAEQILLLLPQLELLQRQGADLTRRIEALLEDLAGDENFGEHRSVEILRSVAGVGRVLTAAVLSEAFTPLVDRDYHALRVLAGVAPVTRQSGKTALVTMRHACNRRLRNATFHAAMVHMQKDPRAHQIYTRLREKGHTHARALRGVADRMLELICLLLRQQNLYDPGRRLVRPGLAA
jgi:transposase